MDKKNFIRLFSGNRFNILDFSKKNYTISDIVLGLARENRFAGQLSNCVSVLTHTLNGYNKLENYLSDYEITNKNEKLDISLAWLLHDAGEGLMKDIPTPIKDNVPEFTYYEDQLMQNIASKYGFTYPSHEIINKIDNDQLQEELSEDNNRNFCITESQEDLIDNINIFLTHFDSLTDYQFLEESEIIRKNLY